jgi:predicted NBD/HSP70 family sugar kinase
MNAREFHGISDHESMKLNNQLTVLRQVRERGPVSRVELQHHTKLSWGTITSAIKELLARGVIEELGAVATGVGRRPVKLDLNTRRNYVLGLDMGTQVVRSALVDIKGRILDQEQSPLDPQGSRAALLGGLLGAARRLVEANSLSEGSLAGIGIAAPGAVDYRRGIGRFAPHHPNWREVPLKARFEKQFGVPCYVDHVSNCFALSEKLFGLGRDLDSFICVLLGSGVSAGIVIHGEVYRGAENFSGEFGHTTIDPDGPPCACGSQGCLEVYASGLALARIGAEEARRAAGRRLLALAGGEAGRVTGELLYESARQGDRQARAIFRRMGTLLGVGVSNLVNLFNPERIVLGGQVSKAHEFFMPALQESLKKRAWHGSTRDVRISRLQDGPVLGAVAIVLQEIFSPGHVLR